MTKTILVLMGKAKDVFARIKELAEEGKRCQK